MSKALHERPGVVAGVLAFLAATVAGLGAPLRGDLSGPVGAVPPLATELFAVAVAPGLAAHLGYRVVQSERVTAAVPWTVAAAAVGAVVGRLVGVQSGFALVRGDVGRVPGIVSVETYFAPTVPFAVAAAVGVLGGLAYRRVTTRSPSSAASPRLLGTVAASGAVAGFALVMALFGGLFTAARTLLPAGAWTVVWLVVAPLAAALGGVTETDTAGADSPRRLGVAAVTGVALGVGTASVYASISGRRTVAFLSSQLDTLAVDAVVAAAVLLLAAVAGVAAGRD